MGTSHDGMRDWLVPYIVEELQPRSMIDLGCGRGLYGRDIKKLDPSIHLVGVEGHRANIRECSMYYDEVILGDIRDYLLQALCYDYTIMIGTIEHFEKEEAVSILGKLVDVIVATPLFEYKQGAVDGNELEIHRCYFNEDEITDLGYALIHKEWTDNKGNVGYIGAFIR